MVMVKTQKDSKVYTLWFNLAAGNYDHAVAWWQLGSRSRSLSSPPHSGTGRRLGESKTHGL